jgi:predicted esterase
MCVSPFFILSLIFASRIITARISVISAQRGENRRIDGLSTVTRSALLELLQYLCSDKLGWTIDCIFIVGFAQGAEAGLDVALHLNDLKLAAIESRSSQLLDNISLPVPMPHVASKSNRLGGLVLLSGVVLPEFQDRHSEYLPRTFNVGHCSDHFLLQFMHFLSAALSLTHTPIYITHGLKDANTSIQNARLQV